MAQLDPEAKELETQVDVIEKRLDRLKSLYEQYFQGIERLEPSMERTTVHRILQDMRKTKIRNTGIRFRINQLVARMNSYENYWNRTTRQMEDGTYKRDVFKARYRSGLRREAEEQSKEEAAAGEQTPSRTQRPSVAAAAGTGLSDENVKAIFDTYMLAKRRCKESTKGLTKDAVASTLRKQVPAIMKQYKCKSVEFKVVIKKGKAVLKAVPKF
jgi:hypothetical protein